MLHLMSVPAGLAAAVQSKAAVVFGAVIKDAVTGQILGHLQPTALLTKALMMSNPVGMALEGVSLISSLGANVQLIQVTRMLETLQTVASIGAVTSVLNLGVSVGGFALVLRSLKRVQGTLDDVRATAQRTESKLDAGFFSKLDTELRRAEETFEVAPERRMTRWEDTEHCMDQQLGELVLRLRSMDVALEGAPLDSAAWHRLSDPEVSGLLSLLSELANARAEALLCLGRPGHAVRLFERTEGWMTALPTDTKAVALQRAQGRIMSTELAARVAREAKAITTLARQGHAVAQERAMLCQSLMRLGVDTNGYVQQVRNHAEPTLLLLPHGTEAQARFEAMAT